MSQAQKRWIHVSFSWPTGGDEKQFEAVFNKAKDWLKYSRNCWLLYTALRVDTWSERVRAIPGMDKQNIFVHEIDPLQANGYLPDWMWEKLYSDD
jgi:hypothetical protein